jgi:hypothetical protein
MWCVDGVWVVMRAGVQASGAISVWVGRVVCSWCNAWGVGGGWDAWGALCGAVWGASRCKGSVVVCSGDGCYRGLMLGESRRQMGRRH